ncbi:3780_t:CDS:2, partial [Funneliformis geosporum]
PEYFIGTSSTTHIVDLESIVSNKEFSTTLKKEGKVRPISILLVDGGPDENPKRMKNIIQYAHLFCILNLDYLTIRIHAPGQSVYNLVERSMASLFAKLAGITLPVREFGSHLNSQGKVVDEVNNIHGKPVMVEYVDQERHPFNDPKPSISWEWIEDHMQMCRYSLDIRKCKNNECYG